MLLLLQKTLKSSRNTQGFALIRAVFLVYQVKLKSAKVLFNSFAERSFANSKSFCSIAFFVFWQLLNFCCTWDYSNYYHQLLCNPRNFFRRGKPPRIIEATKWFLLTPSSQIVPDLSRERGPWWAKERQLVLQKCCRWKVIHPWCVVLNGTF